MLSLGSGGAKSTKPSFVSYVTPEVSESFRAVLYLRCFQNNPESLNLTKTRAEATGSHALGGVRKSHADVDIVDLFKFRQTGKSRFLSVFRSHGEMHSKCNPDFSFIFLHLEVESLRFDD